MILLSPIEVYKVIYFHLFFQGFYSVYRKVFETIAEEDYKFMDDVDDDFEIPSFGSSDSNYQEVSNSF